MPKQNHGSAFPQNQCTQKEYPASNVLNHKLLIIILFTVRQERLAWLYSLLLLAQCVHQLLLNGEQREHLEVPEGS